VEGEENKRDEGMSELNRCFFSLGSNLGDRLANLRVGWEGLRELAQLGTLKCSPIYETEPWGMTRQAWFLNCVVELATAIEPMELLNRLKSIEHSAGRRTHLYRWGPRELDIDILIYIDRQIKQELLTIPHQMMTKRRFVLVPLADLAPELVIPGTTANVRDTLVACVDNAKVVRLQSGFNI
jgi:2-amino-4-hydroxy-6-hydroxymethyldihydropteridine diphosphokinase